MPKIPDWGKDKLVGIETIERRHSLMRLLDNEYQRLYAKHYKILKECGPLVLSTGGGESVGIEDDFCGLLFKTEGIRGVISGLRDNRTIEEAIDLGCTLSEISVGIWNSKREYQAHRWEKHAETYLRYIVRRLVDDIDKELVEWEVVSKQIESRNKLKQEIEDNGGIVPFKPLPPRKLD